MARTDLTAYRLFHGEAEGVLGLAIDRYGDVAILHADSPELLERWGPEVRRDLAAQPAIRTAYGKVHPRRANRLSPEELERLAPSEPLWGPPAEEVDVVELGVRYRVRTTGGLSVGLFLDMRDVRTWLRTVAPDRTVLNLFAYTCSFGVCASLGGARRVLNLDLSRSYLDWGKVNYRLNDVPVDDRDFVYGDTLDWLGRFARRNERFDVVIVDPPSFSSTPFSVRRDYPRLVAAAARVVSPAGMLVAATNHAGTSDEHFEAWLKSGLNVADRHGHLLRSWHEPSEDFPVVIYPYLKVRALLLD